jgi:hypothetical protein
MDNENGNHRTGLLLPATTTTSTPHQSSSLILMSEDGSDAGDEKTIPFLRYVTTAVSRRILVVPILVKNGANDCAHVRRWNLSLAALLVGFRLLYQMGVTTTTYASRQRKALVPPKGPGREKRILIVPS